MELSNWQRDVIEYYAEDGYEVEFTGETITRRRIGYIYEPAVIRYQIRVWDADGECVTKFIIAPEVV